MQLQQLRYLIAVADTGSISAAARHLSITQPVLTRCLRTLERELGVTLFERGTRGVHLTECGLALLARARLIDAETRRAQEELEQMCGGQAGTVTLAASVAPMMSVIPQAIALVRNRFPLLNVHIIECIYPGVLESFRLGQIQFAVGPSPAEGLGAEFVVEELFRLNLVPVVRAGHPHEDAVSLETLVDGEWMFTGPIDGPGDIIESQFAAAGLPAPRCTMRCDTVQAALEMIRHTDCASFVPEPIAIDQEKAGRLRILRIAATPPQLTICLIRPARAVLTPASQALVSAVRMLSGNAA